MLSPNGGKAIVNQTLNLQLRLDVAELEKLQEQATRQKVKGILLVEIRKLQTEISRKEDVAKAPSKEQCDGTAEGAAKPIRTARRLIDMKSYGEETHPFVIMDK